MAHLAPQLSGGAEDGSLCKSFTETIRTKAETVSKEATACRAPGGSWQVQG